MPQPVSDEVQVAGEFLALINICTGLMFLLLSNKIITIDAMLDMVRSAELATLQKSAVRSASIAFLLSNLRALGVIPEGADAPPPQFNA